VQVDFITSKVPDAEITIQPYSGEAGATGAALCIYTPKSCGQPLGESWPPRDPVWDGEGWGCDRVAGLGFSLVID
jgi:hypothetical protein